jgi:hypothetical protein
MVAKSRYFDFHVGVKRQRVQNFVEFRRIVHLEHADVRKLACHSPQMYPFALLLQFLRALMLLRAKFLDFLRVSVVRWCYAA